MRKFILNILLLAGIAGLGVLAAWLVRSCCSGRAEELSPEDTVKAFYSSVIAGDWDKAEDLSAPTDDMKTYFSTCRQFWNEAQKSDSLSLAVASEMLSSADMSLEGGRHEGKDLFRTLFTIRTDDGASKTRKVELVKEGGVWLVSRIAASE